MVQNKATVKDLLLKGSVLSSIDASAYQTYAYIIDHLHEDGNYALKSDLADIDLDSIWERFGEQILAAVSANLSAYALSDVVKQEYSLTSHTHSEYANKTRKIAGKALDEDITAAYLSGAIGLSNYVPTSRTVAGKKLTSNVTAADISNAIKLSSYALSADVSANYSLKTHTHSNYVPTSRTVAGIKLSSDITQARLSSAIGLSNYSLTSHTHSNYVPTSRTVVGLSLSGNITKDQMSDALGLKDGVAPHLHPEYALSSRKVAGKALSGDVTAADISSAIGLGNYVTVATKQDVTGKKTFTDSLNTNGLVQIVNKNIDRTVNYSTATAGGQYVFADKNAKEIGRVVSQINADNSYSTYLQATKMVNGTAVRSSLYSKVADDGTATAYAPVPAISANDARIATTHFVKAQGYALSSRRVAGKQLSGDVTAVDISSAIGLSNYQPYLFGQEGDVAYLTPNDGIKSQTILRSDIYVCENDDDLIASLASKLSFKEVFDSWCVGDMVNNKNYGYSSDYPRNNRTLNECLAFQSNPTAYHWSESNFALTSYSQLTSQEPQSNWYLNQYFYCKPADSSMTSLVYDEDAGYTSCIANMQAYGYDYWIYNNVVSSIIQPMNSIGWSFYYSPLKYTNYDIEVELASTNGDNDYIGLVAAVSEDSSGKQHVLSFIRVGGTNDKNNTYTWMAVVDAYAWPGSDDSHIAAKATVSDDSTANTRNWRDGGKTKVKISRRGNSLSAWTTPFYTNAATSYDSGSRIVLNLASVNNLTCFSTAAGGGSVGFTTNSQPMSYYKILNLNLPKTIAKTYTNELCAFYGDGSGTCTQGNIAKEVGIGRMLKNNATEKTFYATNSSFLKLAEVTEMAQAFIDIVYPVGSIYMSTNQDLPPELSANGRTWAPIDGGQGFWIVNSGDSDLGRHVDGVLPKHTHTYTGAITQSAYGPGVHDGATTSSSKSTGTGSISDSVSGVSIGNTLRQPSFCIRAWRRTS